MRKLALKIASSSLFFVSFPIVAVTAASNSEQGSDLSSGSTVPMIQSNPVWDIVKVLVALAVVVVLLMFTVKWLSRRNRAWSSQRGLRSLGGISLGQSSSLQIIEIADRIYIVGVGEQVTLLDKEVDPDKVAEIVAALEINDQGNMSLASLKQYFAARGKNSSKNAEYNNKSVEMWNDRGSFEDLLQSKLEKQAERKHELESILKDKK